MDAQYVHASFFLFLFSFFSLLSFLPFSSSLFPLSSLLPFMSDIKEMRGLISLPWTYKLAGDTQFSTHKQHTTQKHKAQRRGAWAIKGFSKFKGKKEWRYSPWKASGVNSLKHSWRELVNQISNTMAWWKAFSYVWSKCFEISVVHPLETDILNFRGKNK